MQHHYLGNHDVGGSTAALEGLEKDKIDMPSKFWELQAHALLALLATKKLIVVSELRRGVENLPKQIYDSAPYFGKWTRSFINILLEKGVITDTEIEQYFAKNGLSSDFSKPLETPFKSNDKVLVKHEDFSKFWIRPHLRTPGYIHGCVGTVETLIGLFDAPNLSGFWNRTVSKQRLYRVSFKQIDIWPHYDGNPSDEISIELFEPWLDKHDQDNEKTTNSKLGPQESKKAKLSHSHGSRSKTEQDAIEIDGEVSIDEHLTTGLVELLNAKQIITIQEVNEAIEANKIKGSISNGAKIVIKAWKDESFRNALKKDANEALKTIGLSGSNAHATTKLVCVFNTKDEHHVIVCTLCSCYPSTLLGGSPAWYKSRSYRSRVVVEPRKVLAAFGTTIDQNIKVIVHDSTADCRYMVIPLAPNNLNAMSDADLESLITRDHLIGVQR